MTISTFFVCPNCGNTKKFKLFTSSFQVVEQSPEMGMRINQSGVLPNLRQSDNYVECQACLEKSSYDMATDSGRKYIKTIQI